MNCLHKITIPCVLALCLILAGCSGGPKQAAADSAEEATVNFLTNLQNGEFDQARTYLDKENPLLTVFPVAEGEDAPELDSVYQQFREKLSGLTFRVADEGAVGNSMVYIAATQYDFRSAINEAMLAAMETQCREGGTAIAIAGRGEDFCWPCGACRQMLYEFAPNLRVLAARGDGEYKAVTLSELLPCGFGPKSLE